MDEKRFKQALDIATPEQKVELKIYYNARVDALRSYKNESSVRIKRNLDVASSSLDEMIDKILNNSKKDIKIFRNRLDVVDFLNEQGFKVSKSKLYMDAKKKLLVIEPDGTITREAVERYINHPESNLYSEETDNELIKQKAELEIDQLKEKITATKIKNKIAREDYLVEIEHALAARAAMFKGDLEAFARRSSGEIIDMVSGDPDSLINLMQFLIESFQKILGRYAKRPEIKIGDDQEEEKDDNS